MFRLPFVLCLGIALSLGSPVCAQAPAEPGQEALAIRYEWEQRLAPLDSRPAPPAAWGNAQPDAAQMEAWLPGERARLLRVAAELRTFANNHATAPECLLARRKAAEALAAAQRLGDATAARVLDDLDRERLADPNMSENDRLNIRMRQVQTAAHAQLEASPELASRLYLQGARTLRTEFPSRSEPYAMLLEAASAGESEEARAVVAELATGPVPQRIKDRAQGIQRRLEAVGKPLELKFTSLDGRAVDLAALRGKLVLIDLWATWAGSGLPGQDDAKTTYQKLQGENVEIIGIPLDRERAPLEKYVREKGMAWPQWFDSQSWEGEFATRYGLNRIPTVWLVDTKGVLRDLNAGQNLLEKVSAILREP